MNLLHIDYLLREHRQNAAPLFETGLQSFAHEMTLLLSALFLAVAKYSDSGYTKVVLLERPIEVGCMGHTEDGEFYYGGHNRKDPACLEATVRAYKAEKHKDIVVQVACARRIVRVEGSRTFHRAKPGTLAAHLLAVFRCDDGDCGE